MGPRAAQGCHGFVFSDSSTNMHIMVTFSRHIRPLFFFFFFFCYSPLPSFP
jgi:hypothetical protein